MNNSPDLWLKRHKALARHQLSLISGIGLFNGLLLIGQAYALSLIVAGVVIDSATLAQLQWPLWSMLTLFTTRALLSLWLERFAAEAAAKIKLQLRDDLYARLLELGPLYLRGERSGELLNTLSEGVEALEAYYSRYLPAMSLAALLPLALLVAVFPFDWWSGLILLGTAPLIPLFMILIGKGAEALNQKQWRKLARLSAHFLDLIQGLTTLKLFNASRREAASVAKVADDYRRSTMKVLRVAFLSSLVLEFFATVSVAVVAVLIGFRLLWGDMDFQIGFFILLLAPEFYLPLRQLGSHYHARMEAIGAAEKMIELFEAPLPQRATITEPLADGTPLIELRQVSFAYPGSEAVLRDINLTISPGERLAIVGPSGAGKSTLMNLLLGFAQPSEGELLVNNIPLSRIEPQQWYAKLAWVPQRPRLFAGSIADNLRLAKADASDAELIAAARLASAHSFIEPLPHGYQTELGELGSGLSGGQIQRIALARAFLKQAAVVLLDEATANLDRASESLLIDALQKLPAASSVVFIAHRLATLRAAERIVVLEAGRIVASGSHSELLESCPLYQQLNQRPSEVA